MIMLLTRNLIITFTLCLWNVVSCDDKNECSMDSDCFTCCPPPTTTIECKNDGEVIIIKDSKFVYDGQKKLCESRTREDLLESFRDIINNKQENSCISTKYNNLRRSCTGRKICQIKLVEKEDCPGVSRPQHLLHSYIYYQYICLKAKVLEREDLPCFDINEGTYNIVPKVNISSVCLKFKLNHIRLSIKVHLKSGLGFNQNCKYGTLNGQQIKILFSKRNDAIFGNVELKNSTQNNVTIMLVGCEWLYGSITVERILSSPSLREISEDPISLLPKYYSKNPDKTTTIIIPTDGKTDGKSSRKMITIIVICVITLLVIVLAVIFGVIYLKRRRRNDSDFSENTHLNDQQRVNGDTSKPIIRVRSKESLSSNVSRTSMRIKHSNGEETILHLNCEASEVDSIEMWPIDPQPYESGVLDDTPKLDALPKQRLLPKVPPPIKEESYNSLGKKS
ncbi:DgyrCDS5677 [Dimorphilus gyrociliatus]|uniref:DgyrCDS5677 n=1 Tax=Dimorphilus gyrociliatus TaxID=2664684 RepID=A0A7I8VNC1_9ANNE|nr:DgyrCDS5677 [Dimorphilus gyrociliatus]